MLSNILFFSQLYTRQNGGNPFSRLNSKVQRYKKIQTWNNFSKNYIFTLPITSSQLPPLYPLRTRSVCSPVVHRLFNDCLTVYIVKQSVNNGTTDGGDTEKGRRGVLKAF